MVSQKDKRNSGRYTPKATSSPKEIKENNIHIPIEYDDWRDRRDSFRDNYRDFKHIKKVKNPYHCKLCELRDKMNKKQTRLNTRRKVR